MARIRTIKPQFFKHERLYDLERETGFPLRVAFAGLWTVADREGRFHWRPRTLKTDVLPHDELDFAAVLEALERGGFILRYQVGLETYGEIPSWLLHQHINLKEADSIIPARESTCEHVPDAVPARSGSRGERKGKERKGKEGDARACIDTEELTERLRNIGFRDSKSIAVEHEIVDALESGCDPGALEQALRDIYTWTSSGEFAPRLSEVIRRHKEPRHLWERKKANPDAPLPASELIPLSVRVREQREREGLL